MNNYPQTIEHRINGRTTTLYLAGTVTLAERFTHHLTEEYAAWWTDVETPPQTVPFYIELDHEGCARTGELPRINHITATLAGKVVEDYHASHFGGVAVGSYDTKQNAGKPREVHIGAGYLHGFLSADREIHPEFQGEGSQYSWNWNLPGLVIEKDALRYRSGGSADRLLCKLDG